MLTIVNLDEGYMRKMHFYFSSSERDWNFSMKKNGDKKSNLTFIKLYCMRNIHRHKEQTSVCQGGGREERG